MVAAVSHRRTASCNWRSFEPMTTADRAQPAAAAPGPFAAWRTRDILVAAVIGVVFGVAFFLWNGVYAFFNFLQPSILQDWIYGGWLVPAILAPLIVRKP